MKKYIITYLAKTGEVQKKEIEIIDTIIFGILFN